MQSRPFGYTPGPKLHTRLNGRKAVAVDTLLLHGGQLLPDTTKQIGDLIAHMLHTDGMIAAVHVRTEMLLQAEGIARHQIGYGGLAMELFSPAEQFL